MTLVREVQPVGTTTVSTPAAAASKSSSSIGRHVASLDGYRGFALVMMLLYHSEVSWVKGGYFSLTLFFTLSGFLITSMLLRAFEKGGIGLRVFWARRFRRLMPAAMLGLVAAVIFGATVATRQQLVHLPGEVFAASTYWINWFFILTHQSYVNLFAAPSPLQHYWSLSVEEQFYLLMPIGMIAFLRRRPSPRTQMLVFGGGALLSTAWMLTLYKFGASLDRLYYGTDTRVAEILTGGLLAVVMHHHGFNFTERARKVIAVIGVVMFAFIVWASVTFSIVNPWVYRGGFQLVALASCVALASMVVGGPLTVVLGVRPLAALGRVSYGVYIFHWPIFLWLTPARTGLSLWPLFALRVGLSLAVAIASYLLVEIPIRNGVTFGLRSAARWSLIPLAALVVFAGSIAAVNHEATDPLATLRAEDSTLVPPVQPADGVLDMLVIPGTKNDPVVARMQELAAPEHNIKIAVAPVFACDGITTTNGGPVCKNWLQQWPALIRSHNPDVVLFAVDDWPLASLRRLSGERPAQLAGFASQTLDRGFDLLSTRGANIVFAPSGANFATALKRSVQPFYIAMGQLETQRTNLRHVIGTRLPDPATVSAQAYRDRSAAALISDADLYQRAGASRLPKVMVVGDSQARSLGFGLERWGPAQKQAVVWNVATEGCGVAADGQVFDAVGRPGAISANCKAAVRAWRTQVQTFRPDMVIVLSSLWDTRTRKLDSWNDFSALGDARLDTYLRQTYTQAIDTLGSTGARIVWMTAPCIKPASSTAGQFELARKEIDLLNNEVVRPVVRSAPGKATLFDLDKILCPGGQYRNRVPGVRDVRVDGVHFSVDGAMWFADTYGKQLVGIGGK